MSLLKWNCFPEWHGNSKMYWRMYVFICFSDPSLQNIFKNRTTWLNRFKWKWGGTLQSKTFQWIKCLPSINLYFVGIKVSTLETQNQLFLASNLNMKATSWAQWLMPPYSIFNQIHLPVVRRISMTHRFYVTLFF